MPDQDPYPERVRGLPGEPSRSAVFRRVFSLFPYGILVLERGGRVLAWNREAVKLAPQLAEVRGVSCCELFGCRSGEGPLADCCLSEPAGERVELRVPWNRGGEILATAAPLGGSSSPLLVVELRAHADPDGSAAATEPQRLRIAALGPTHVANGHGPHAGPWLEQRQGEILKYLVCHRRQVVSVEQIATAMWPNADRRAVDRVRYFVHELRNRLEPERATRDASFIVTRRGGYSLDAERVSVDIDDFERQLSIGLSRRGSPDAAALERAVALYQGDLFADSPYLDWALAERDRLRDLAASGLRALVNLRLAGGDLDGADAHLQRLAGMESFDLEIQRMLITLSLQRGRRSQAFRRYSSLRQRWLRSFNEPLDFDLDDARRDVGPFASLEPSD